VCAPERIRGPVAQSPSARAGIRWHPLAPVQYRLLPTLHPALFRSGAVLCSVVTCWSVPGWEVVHLVTDRDLWNADVTASWVFFSLFDWSCYVLRIHTFFKYLVPSVLGLSSSGSPYHCYPHCFPLLPCLLHLHLPSTLQLVDIDTTHSSISPAFPVTFKSKASLEDVFKNHEGPRCQNCFSLHRSSS